MIEQRSPEWFAARRGRVTGSVAGAILGLSPYMTRADVMRKMVRDWHGLPSEFTGNAATEWGQFNEAGATIEYQMETAHKVEPCGFFEYGDWLGASPDGLVYENGLIEIKCPYGLRNELEPAFKSIAELPHYYAQIQIELLCSGRTWCDFYQWTPRATQTKTVCIDKDWLAKNIPKLFAFYSEFRAVRDTMPIEQYDMLPRAEIETQDAALLLSAYDELTKIISMASELQKQKLAELVALAGGNDAEMCGRKLTLVKREGTVSYAKALKAIAPDADLEPYRGKPTEYWKLS